MYYMNSDAHAGRIMTIDLYCDSPRIYLETLYYIIRLNDFGSMP